MSKPRARPLRDTRHGFQIPPFNYTTIPTSINIPKIQILPIRQVPIRRRTQIPSLKSTRLRCLNPIPSRVFSLHEEPKCRDQTCFDEVGDDHAPDAEGVGGGLGGFVEEGAGDVACAVA